jgi:serine/threonine protein kinase
MDCLIWLRTKNNVSIISSRSVELQRKVCLEYNSYCEDNWPGVSILPFYYELIPSKSVIHARSLRQFIYTSSKHHIDDLFVDLIDKMLQVNPENRISAKEALNHRFFFSDPEATPPSQ